MLLLALQVCLRDLQRKIGRAGHSVVVTLPSQLAELADLGEGDVVEFAYLGRGALCIEKEEELGG